MKLKYYYQVGKLEGLTGLTLERYTRYMQTRWPKEEEQFCGNGYAGDWAYRFHHEQEYHMSDSAGLEVLKFVDRFNPKLTSC